MAGKFIVFEGLDGVGKSTQAHHLAKHLDAVYTKQPGGDSLMKPLKKILLNPHSQISDYVEALIFTADRALHVQKVLRPALESGRDVVCDRYTGSFLAYQGYGRGGDIEFLKDLNQRATGGLEPDLVILLWEEDFKKTSRGRDRIEREDAEFQKRVMDGYLKILEENPDTWVLVKRADSKDEIKAKIRDIVEQKLYSE